MSWWELKGIQDEARTVRRAQAAMPPTACPNDGTILLRDVDGRLRCKFDGWVWDGVSHPLVAYGADDLVPLRRVP